MLRSTNAKRFRAIALALAVTFTANYAISYAARSGQTVPGSTPKPRAGQLDRSGQSVPGVTPKPAPR